MATSSTKVRVIPTGCALAAEVRGLDLAEKVPPEIRFTLLEAWTDHLVLLFREQELNEDQFLGAARIFGELQVSVTRERAAARLEPERAKVSRSETCVLHNLDADGRPTARNAGAGSSELAWHSDNSYADVPPAGSMLYALEVPPSGGNTYFANQYRAYDALPGGVRAAIKDRTAVHDYSRDGVGRPRPGLMPAASPDQVPGAHHSIVRTHPVSRRRSLYLGRRYEYPSQYIDGMAAGESERLLDILWAHATDPDFVWCHVWRRGDVLLWDNRCTLHRRDAVPPTAPRVMQRTLISEAAAPDPR